jgi:hypothetical protein
VVKSVLFENLMIVLVAINTVLLAMNRYGQPDKEDYILNVVNIIFTLFYLMEMLLRLCSFGIVQYFSEPFNFLDCSIVVISLTEIIFLDGQAALSAFLALRVFKVLKMLRAFRVLRVAKLFKSLHMIQQVIEVIEKTIAPFLYTCVLLLIFIFIYSLIGMQLFGGKMDMKGERPRQNFDSFHKAFLSMFQVLTLEDWQNLLFTAVRAQNPIVCSVYFISWIFLGNFVLLNLLLAFVLDAFISSDKETKEDLAKKVRIALETLCIANGLWGDSVGEKSWRQLGRGKKLGPESSIDAQA